MANEENLVISQKVSKEIAEIQKNKILDSIKRLNTHNLSTIAEDVGISRVRLSHYVLKYKEIREAVDNIFEKRIDKIEDHVVEASAQDKNEWIALAMLKVHRKKYRDALASNNNTNVYTTINIGSSINNPNESASGEIEADFEEG